MNKINHVAIIMDGNGRWAIKNGLKRTEGHKKGSETLEKITVHLSKKGIKYLSLFAFSTENWNRPISEIKFLMNYSSTEIAKFRETFNKENIKIIWSGTERKLYKSVISELKKSSNTTKNNTGMVLNICLNYGSRNEILDAVNFLIKNKKTNKKITEKSLSNNFYNNLPDVDLLVRTSGEKRISNFLLWQIAYAELFFTNTLWPDFTISECDKIMDEYLKRNRRYGGV